MGEIIRPLILIRISKKYDELRKKIEEREAEEKERKEKEQREKPPTSRRPSLASSVST
ncbi:hypothetical protein DPMN_121791 [Dreissena polymorpha]|uniref:Uncharacterized protein n=1 Tax=Dreissena polymorpha TaxID=45954 RepID=A0A9D4GNG2_DREPO|nr:hypothetical protein DPMN_121791 [Dreissena polymorpha]